MPPRRRGKGAKKAPRASGASSIESLPDGVLEHILGFLPAQDAVRSCVLARRWRDLWMSATGLRIIANGNDDDMNELRKFVDHLLLLRGIAPLETCELWFRHALELVGVYVEDGFLSLSECPALEQLKIEDCDMFLVKKISSESLKRLSITKCTFSNSSRTRIQAPSLVSLQLDDNCYNTPVLESMPSLVDASIRIAKSNVDSCGSCDSGDCNSCHGIVHSNNNCILLEGLSKTTNLALIAESKTLVFRLDLKRCPTFSKLKTLLLSDYWCVALDLDAITCILKNSPLLEKLTIEYFLKGSEHKMEMKGSCNLVQRTDAISEHLKIVVVKCDVVDEKVYRVLKLLSTFNIHKLTSSSIRFLSIPKVLAPHS